MNIVWIMFGSLDQINRKNNFFQRIVFECDVNAREQKIDYFNRIKAMKIMCYI